MSVDKYVRKNYFKIIVAGEGGVGKTTFSKRLTGKLEADEILEMTPGVDFHSLKIKKDIINLQFWDLGGQEQFRYFQPDFFGGATVVLLIYAVDMYNSFKSLDAWLEYIPEEMYKNIFLIGNKIDTDKRSVKMEDALNLAEKKGLKGYYEISALNSVGIEEFQSDLVNTIEEMYLERKKRDKD